MAKIEDFTYDLSFEGKTVRFHMFRDDPTPPKRLKLLSDEVYVAPSFDESGLRFALIYNTTAKWLYWVLNEDGFVPEDFNLLDSNTIVIGQRNGRGSLYVQRYLLLCTKNIIALPRPMPTTGMGRAQHQRATGRIDSRGGIFSRTTRS